MEPPVVARDRLDGWRRTEETVERPFEAGPVSVTAATAQYERDGTAPRPFLFASRLRIRPAAAPNAALTRLVEERSRAGFRGRLADRDVESVSRRDERAFTVDDPTASTATLWTFRGRCTVGGSSVPVEALLAVWESGEYLVAGGGYPVDGDRDATRRDVLAAVRGVRPPGSNGGDRPE